MTSQHLNRILCAGQPGDSSDGAERILEAASGAGAEVIALVGDLAHDPGGYRDLFRTLARARQPVYWVPGAGDAPVDRYLRASYNIEVAFPTVRGLHGTAAFAPRAVEILGTTLVVAPGSLADGHYALAELHAGTAELAELSVAAR